MKTSNLIIPTILLVLLSFFSSCDGILNDTNFGVTPETQVDMTNLSLRLGKEGIYIEETMPSTSGSGVSVNGYPQTVQVSAGVLLFFNYSTNDNDNICSMNMQIEGSRGYWNSPVERDAVSGQLYARVLIPNIIKAGDFRIAFSVEDCNGKVSPLNFVNTMIAEPLQCNTGFSGSVGVTVLSAYLGNKAGMASIDFEHYSIPDKIDIRYNNQWVASTRGTVLATNEVPNCSIYSTAAGFVSGSGSLFFNYNPNLSSVVEIYVTGCDNSTAWNIDINCP